MTSRDRLDPPAFFGCFAYVDSDIPPGMTLADWRSRRSGSPGFDSSTTSGAPRAGPVLAPHDRTPRARMAHGPHGGRGLSPGRKR
jgi:hypothetical protein